MSDKILTREGKVKRHSASVIFVHWTVAISSLMLLFTGFGQMPLYKRYGLSKLPYMGWTADFGVTLNLHYMAAIVLTFAAFYHVVYHVLRKEFGAWPKPGDFKESVQIVKAMLTKGQEPPSHKFLAEQRLAYAFMAITLGVLIITGLIKVFKNLPDVFLPDSLLNIVTMLHNLATMLLLFGFIAHLAAFLLKPNRPLLLSMFTGMVDYHYAKERHCLWCEELEKGAKKSPPSQTLESYKGL